MPTLSASGLLYLGADAVVPKDKKLSMGLDVPCRETSVDLKTASAVLVAAAFLALRDSGAVTVAVEQKKGLLGTKSRVAVRRAGGGAPAGLVEPGLLGAIGDKQPYARDTVHTWLQRDTGNPWGVVVGVVEGELVNAGLLQAVQATGMLGKLGAAAGARPKTTPDCAAIAAVRPQVDAALSRWQTFDASEAELAQALVKECRDGIDRRLESD